MIDNEVGQPNFFSSQLVSPLLCRCDHAVVSAIRLIKACDPSLQHVDVSLLKFKIMKSCTRVSKVEI